MLPNSGDSFASTSEESISSFNACRSCSFLQISCHESVPLVFGSAASCSFASILTFLRLPLITQGCWTQEVKMAEDTRFLNRRLIQMIFIAVLLLHVSKCNGDDAQALLAIKESLNHTSALANWTGSNPCNWTGVQCDGTPESGFRRVVRLSLPDANLTGTLDPAIGNLSAIQEVNLTQNQIDGRIPSELQHCRELQALDLSHNRFSGNFSGLFKLTGLVTLNLAGNFIKDSLPPAIGMLKGLQVLDLSLNEDLFGIIPPEIGNCTGLQILNLSRRGFLGGPSSSVIEGFDGWIPASLGNCTRLQYLDLASNTLSGSIPSSLLQLTELRGLKLDRNDLNGTLDQMQSTAARLEHLSLRQNRLHGELPVAMFNLTNLVSLVLSGNKFTGTIPNSVGNLTKLNRLLLANNNLTGLIPPEIGRLSKLQMLNMFNNALEGPIPRQFSACKDLWNLNLQKNHFNTAIPREIGNLTSLHLLALGFNELTGIIPAEIANCSNLVKLDLSSNQLSGILPGSLGVLPKLSLMYMDDNQLTGAIPTDYSEMVRLEYLVLSYNFLTGTIPNNFSENGPLLNLEVAHNRLSGSMPSSLSKLCCLQKIDVSVNQLSGTFHRLEGRLKTNTTMQLQHIFMYENNFTGELPQDWTAMTSLLTLDMHGNKLEGQIPNTWGNYFQITRVDFSSNLFTGPLPTSMGLATFLTFVNLSNNHLTGTIPPSLVMSWATERSSNVTLDLSNNGLTGEIPKELNLSVLNINVSNNKLSGCIPKNLQGLSAAAFLGNSDLSGAPLSEDCERTRSGKRLSTGRFVAVVLASSCVGVFLAASLIYCCRWRSEIVPRRGAQSTGVEISSTTSVQGWFSGVDNINDEAGYSNKSPRLNPTYLELSRATNGFSSWRIIGDGGFGVVYKGELRDGTIVAIKKFTEHGCQGEREFFAELDTLGNIRHRNLVRLVGGCWNSTERLLVYEFMPNNSLESWLHGRMEGMEPLPWGMRMVIARDIARGLTFLHHFCVPKVIHRDLKSSNILLDSAFNAKLADFGLARHLNTYETHMSTQVAGSLGYIAPEYAQTWRATTKGDVFSFGVVMLELLCGRRPAGENCYKPIHGGNLLGWIRYLFRTDQVLTLFFDPTLGPVQSSEVESDLMVVLDIALRCTHDDPSRRPAMLDVLRSLEDQRSDGLTTESSLALVLP